MKLKVQGKRVKRVRFNIYTKLEEYTKYLEPLEIRFNGLSRNEIVLGAIKVLWKAKNVTMDDLKEFSKMLRFDE